MLGIGLLKTGFWFCFLVLWLLLHLGSCKASVILLFESYYLVACMQAHLCNLGKIILVVEPPSSKGKWAFSSAYWWVHCQNFSLSSQKWACSQANYLGIKNLRLAKDNKCQVWNKKKHYGKRLRPWGRKKQAKKKNGIWDPSQIMLWDVELAKIFSKIMILMVQYYCYPFICTWIFRSSTAITFMQYVAKISEKPEKQVIKYFCISASHWQYGLLVELKKQEHISFPEKCALKIYHCI